MPKYAVVICPDCRNPFIIEPGPKTVSCRRCNKRHEAAKLRVFIATDDFRQAQAALGSINAHVCGDPTFDAEVDGTINADESPPGGRSTLQGRQGPRGRKDARRGEADPAKRTDSHAGRNVRGVGGIRQWQCRHRGILEESLFFSGISRKKFDEWVEKMIRSGAAYSPTYGILRKG